jgi:hypothetical protein
MFSEVLLFGGLIALSLGLRSFQHPVIFRLGHLGLMGTTYLFGYRTTNRHSIGALLASIWVLFPWIEILGRIRHVQIPSKRTLSSQPAPGARTFPELEELTEEAEAEGFTLTDDLGWRGDDHRQFMRILTHAQKRIQATIHYVESEEAEFFYVTVSSRTEKGTVWNTWNYPFLLSLKPAPTWRFQLVSGHLSFLQILSCHEGWLSKNGITSTAEIPSEPEAVHVLVEQDAAALVSHNLTCGVLAPGDEGMVRYTFRGCWFLWTQFIRDLIGSR